MIVCNLVTDCSTVLENLDGGNPQSNSKNILIRYDRYSYSTIGGIDNMDASFLVSSKCPFAVTKITIKAIIIIIIICCIYHTYTFYLQYILKINAKLSFSVQVLRLCPYFFVLFCFFDVDDMNYQQRFHESITINEIPSRINYEMSSIYDDSCKIP